METGIENDTSRSAVVRKPAYWPWVLLWLLSVAAFAWVYLAIPAEQFPGFWAGVFLLSLGLGFAFGGICLWTIWTGRRHA
jgi:hypothetical protein